MAKNKDEGLKFFPKNDEQRQLLRSLEENPLTVCRSIKYGSGKTFCAIGYACEQLRAGKIERVIFCRDSTDLSSRLGYMPGTRSEKLAESMKFAVTYFKLFLGKDYQGLAGAIQYRDVADIAGETFIDSIMILDEASNCTKEDIEMFLSRAGRGTRCVILGTESQMTTRSHGFRLLFERLGHLSCVGLVELREILRNGWMAEVLSALETCDA